MRDRFDVAEPLGSTLGPQLFRRLKPGPGRSAREVSADQRERIQRAMVQLVADVGYRKVTVRKLTRLAGVSPSAFYSQFDGKEECFVDTYALVMAAARARISSTRRVDQSKDGQLADAITRLMAGLAADADVTHMALVEAFAGGPAALQQIHAAETAIDQTLRECLDRREACVSPAAVSWITAGTMHVARDRTLRGATARLLDETEALVRWGRTYLDEEAPDLSQRHSRTHGAEPTSDPRLRSGLEDVRSGAGDRDLIVAATLRLARAKGYWSLNTPQIRDVAGLSAARFNRHFCDVESCYLAAMRPLARHYFDGCTSTISSDADWTGDIYRNVSGLCRKIAADPDLAKLLFIDILTPGVDGMRRRESLITKLAEAGRRLVPEQERSQRMAAKATAAALWASVAQELASGRGRTIDREASTYTFMILAPVIGVDAAAMTLERERQRDGTRSRHPVVPA